MNKRKRSNRHAQAEAPVAPPCVWARRYDAVGGPTCCRCPLPAGYLLQVRCDVHHHGYEVMLCDGHLSFALGLMAS